MELLERNYNFTKSLFDTAQAIILVLDKDGAVRTFNPYMEELSGYKLEEVKGKDWFETFLPHQDWQKVRELFKSAINDIQTHGNVNPIITKDGLEVYIEWFDKTLKDDAGNVIGLLAIGHDITERKLAEDNLRKSEERNRKILDNSIVGFYQIDKTGKFLYANKAYCNIIGYSLEEVIELSLGKNIEANESPEDVAQHIAKVVRTGYDSFETRHKHKDGRLVDVEINVNYDAGVGDFLFGFVRNITGIKQAEKALRESEAQLKIIFEQAAVGVAQIETKTGRFVRINKKYCDIVGYSVEEMTQLTFMKITHPEDLQEDLDNVKRLDSGEIREFTMEKRYYKKNGSIVWVNLTVSPMWAIGEEPNYHIAIVEDITDSKYVQELLYLNQRLSREIKERTQSEKKRRELEKKLLHARKMEAVGTLAAGIAHDFNNILNIITGGVEYTKSIAPPGGQILENMKIISEAGERAASLVRQILTFSRQTEQIKQPLSLHPLIKELMAPRQNTMPESIKIKEKIDPACGAISADPVQMQQVIANLIVNAIQAMEEHGGVLEIGLQEEAAGPGKAQQADLKPGTYAHFWVSDTGHGMDRKTVGKIFDPYFTTKEKKDGVGLGLAIVYGILEEHNATISVRSAVGKGTTFDVYFPLAEAIISAEEEKKPETQVSRGSGRILFVDDEQMNVVNWQMVLKGKGYQVVGETDPLAALEKFKENPTAFDFVVTDQIMPNMSGLGLTRRLKEIRPDIPIVLTTGWAESIDSELLDKYNVQLLHKPYRAEDFFSALKKALKR